MRPRLRWFQLSLRTLLAGITLAAIAAAWWFHPFVVETRRADGSLRTRFEVRRDWRGEVVANGSLKWFCRDGNVFTRTCYGERLGEDEFADVLTRDGDFDSLIWLITETVAPDTWVEVGGPGSITGFGRIECFFPSSPPAD
jgi:hypothetical protein